MIDRVGKISRFVLNAARKGSAKWAYCGSLKRHIIMLTVNQSTNDFKFTFRASHEIVNNRNNEQYCLFCTRYRFFFLRATVFSASTKKNLTIKIRVLKVKIDCKKFIKFRDVFGLTGDCSGCLQKLTELFASSSTN